MLLSVPRDAVSYLIVGDDAVLECVIRVCTLRPDSLKILYLEYIGIQLLLLLFFLLFFFVNRFSTGEHPIQKNIAPC